MISRLIQSISIRGIRDTASLAYYQVSDVLRDFRLGVRTAKKISGKEPRFKKSGYEPYAPSMYHHIYQILEHIRKPTEQDVFIDYGCGKGRVLLVASTYSFKRIIGIELSSEYSNAARQNIRKALPKLICKDVEVINVNAESYKPPLSSTHFFFYNPFGDEVLSKVLENILVTLNTNPRNITIIYVPQASNPQTVLDGCGWLKKMSEFQLNPSIYSSVARIYSNG